MFFASYSELSAVTQSNHPADDRDPSSASIDPGESSPESVGEAPYPAPAYAWYVVAVLMVIYVFNFMDRMILNLLVTPIKRDLEISDTQMSYLMGFSFALFYTLFGFPMGRLADRVNRKSLIGAGLLVWTMMTAGCGLAKQYWHFLCLRVGVGVGEATLGPSAYSIIADYFPKEKRGRALSLYSYGIFLGAGLAVLIGGTVTEWAAKRGPISMPIVGTVFPWQIVFLIVGVAGIPPLVLLLTIREPERRGARYSTDDQGQKVVERLPYKVVLAYLGKNRMTVLCHHIGFSWLAFSSYGVGAWAPAFMERTHGWGAGRIGVCFGSHVIFVGGLGILLGGWLTDSLLRRGHSDSTMRVGLIASILWIPFGLTYPLVANEWLCWALMAASYFFVTFPIGSAAAAIMNIVPNAMRGQATALYFFAVNLIGLGIGPSAVAWCTDYVFRDESLIGYSIIIVGVGAHAAAIVAFALGLKPYRESVARLEEWEREHVGIETSQ